jgi:hypothetical protein
MGFRFWKRVRLAPGVTLNLSKSGASLSVGPEGAKVTVGSSGAHVTLGAPGTGLFWTGRIGGGGSSAKPARSERPQPPAEIAWNEGVAALLEDRIPAAVDRLAVAWQDRAALSGGRASIEVPLTAELVLALGPDK